MVLLSYVQVAALPAIYIAKRHLSVAFIIPGAIGSVIMWMYFPDTIGKPLEEVAAMFGDHDEVAGYMKDIEVTEEDLQNAGGFGHEKGVMEKTEIEKHD